MFERIAIMGTGSLGTILGAFISKARQVDLIDVNQAHVDALNERGAHISGWVDMTVPVTALTPDQMEGAYDLYIYMAKQTYNESCLPQMKKHSHENTYVCCCQNGIPEMAVAEYFGKEHTIGCTVGWGATWLGPGESELTTTMENSSFHIGTVVGPITPELLEVKQILELMCPAIESDNLMGDRWTKMVANCAFSGMSAVLGCTFGEVLDDPKAVKCAEYIGRECIRVTHAQGYTMEKVAGGALDPEASIDFHNEEERNSKAYPFYYAIYNTANRRSIASMLQDIQKGRPCEIMAINGVLSATGKQVGVPTPVCDKVVEIVTGIEAGKYKPCFENLELFTVFEA